MKQLYSLLILMFICSLNILSKQISTNDSYLIAELFAQNNINKHILTRNATDSKLSLAYTAKSYTRSNTPNTYYYIYNIGENNGFVIISGDDVNYPIIGYSNEGHYNPNNLPDNFKEWMQAISLGIEKAIDENIEPSPEIKNEWVSILENKELRSTQAGQDIIVPLLKTTWNQDSPYNKLLPYKGLYTGCVATATAQIMKYYNYPQTGIGITPSYNVNNDNTTYNIPEIKLSESTYDWNNMLTSYYAIPTVQQENAVALLMYHVAAGMKTNFGKSGSSSNGVNAANALFTYFDYDKGMQHLYRNDIDTDEEWNNILLQELKERRPIFYGGTSPQNSGHAFVCDGYDGNQMFHFNWGWGGYLDGYYQPSAALEYNRDQDAIINIKPNEGGSGNITIQIINNTPFSANVDKAKVGSYFNTVLAFRNYSLLSFNGYYGIALTDKDNNIKYILKESALSYLGSMYYYAQYNFNSCYIPKDALLGKYQLRLVYKTAEDSDWSIASNPSQSVTTYLTFEIIGDESPCLVTKFESDKDIIKTNENFSINVSLSNYGINRDVRIGLYDKEDNLIHIIETITSPSLNYTCQIPSSVSSGDYYIKIVQKDTWDNSYIPVMYEDGINDLSLFVNNSNEMQSLYANSDIPYPSNDHYKYGDILFSYPMIIYSKRPIEGYFADALVDSNNNVKYILDYNNANSLRKTNTANTVSGMYWIALSFADRVLPDNIKDGDYICRIVFREKGSNDWKVLNKQPGTSYIDRQNLTVDSQSPNFIIYNISATEDKYEQGSSFYAACGYSTCNKINNNGIGVGLFSKSGVLESIVAKPRHIDIMPTDSFGLMCILEEDTPPGEYSLKFIEQLKTGEYRVINNFAEGANKEALISIISKKESLLVNNLKTIEKSNTSIIYPNPATDLLYIQTDNTIQKAIISDLSGKIVLQVSKQKIIPIESLRPGTYIINIYTDENSMISNKFIKE